MVYKDLTMEEAQKRFEEITTTVETAEVVEPMAETRVGKEKRKRKVVKALVAKS